MDVATIISQARGLSKATTGNYSDALMLQRLNDIYHPLCDEVKLINENYYRVSGTFDTTVYKNQYDFSLPTSTVVSVDKMIQVLVKYEIDNFDPFALTIGFLVDESGNFLVDENGNFLIDSTMDYSQGDKIVYDTISYICNTAYTSRGDWATESSNWTKLNNGYQEANYTNYSLTNLYDYNQTTSNSFNLGNTFINQFVNGPVYTILSGGVTTTGNLNRMSIQIYPRPEIAIKEGIKYIGIRTVPDLTLTSTEADILIDRKYHPVLIWGLLPYIYKDKNMPQDKQLADNDYLGKKQEMLRAITDRNMSPTSLIMPNLVGLG